EADVELVGMDIGAERPTHLDRLDRAAAFRPAADLIDEVAQRDAERGLKQPAMLYIAGDLDRHSAFRALYAERLVLAGTAFGHDMRHGGKGKDVVYHGRLAEQAFERRKRRLGAHFAALAFKAVEQRCFLAADIGARARADFNFERSDDPGGKPRGGLHLADRVGIFAAQVDIPLLRPDRLCGDRHALDQGEGIAFHQHAVGKGAAVALVGVADNIFGLAGRQHHGAPLDARGEARAAPAAQARLGHFLDYLFAADLARAAQARPAAGRLIILKAQRAGFACPREGQPLLPGDEGMLLDPPDGLAAAAVQDRVDIVERSGAETAAVHLH